MNTGTISSSAPGAVLPDFGAGDIEANVGRATTDVVVQHLGDRPIQVGSHFHFFETNRKLKFDRTVAYGMRLNIPAGTAVRFEPGEEKSVTLVALGGSRVMLGCNGLVGGALDDEAVRDAALAKMAEQGFESI
ncbi:MAG: urease subunit beta [Chloroflexota bacterium]